MSNIMIKPGTPPAMAKAIADGALKAENKALLETIDMLICEIAHKDELLELYRWKEQREREQVLMKYRDRLPRLSVLKRLGALIASLTA